MTEYIEIRCAAPVDLEDELVELVGCEPSRGCQISSKGGDGIEIRVFFDRSDVDRARRLGERLGDAGARDVTVRVFSDADWVSRYWRHARPFEVGRRWWIDPRPGRRGEHAEGRIRLVVEPRLAFGSGLHPSTRLILLELEDIGVEGSRVLDVGTGSGILALAAEALGASLVVGLDVDPQAIWVAHGTRRAQQRRVGLHLAVSPVEGLVASTFDLALCNMSSDTSRGLLPAIRRRLVRGGRMVLSGMVGEETDGMTAELAALGFDIEGIRELDGWTAARAVRDGT